MSKICPHCGKDTDCSDSLTEYFIDPSGSTSGSMLTVGGKPFRCYCGCNVFMAIVYKNGGKGYKCNACPAIYVAE